MASISRDPKGNRTIQFVAGDGKRRSIRLGKLPLKAVNEIKTKIEALNAAAIAGIGWDRETAEWVGSRESTLYDRLAAVGLVPKRATPELATIGPFIDGYITSRKDLKPQTQVNLQQVKRDLVLYFGANKPMAEVTEGDADDWRIWLAQTELKEAGKFIKRKLGPNTVRRRCGRARQLFRAAVKRRLIGSNPFADMKGIAVQANAERFYFVTREEAYKVIDACPDNEWRLLFALSRFGGLRCPSEHLTLRWSDVDLPGKKMTVRSTKTEAYEGKATRVVPIFPELMPYLQAAWDEAKERAEYVICRYRDANSNLRTQLQRIIARAGLTAWPKLWQNLRSTRETELAESVPIHLVCQWLGNSEAVARKHYLQITTDHMEQAANVPTGIMPTRPTDALHKAVQQPAESSREDSQLIQPALQISGGCDLVRQCTSNQVTPTGLEPVLPA